VTYECQSCTINSSISECDNICETQHAEPEIWTDCSSQTLQNLRVDGQGSGFDPPTVSVLGFGMGLELNQPVFAVQTGTTSGLPEPIANTTLQSMLLGARSRDWLSCRCQVPGDGWQMVVGGSRTRHILWYPILNKIFNAATVNISCDASWLWWWQFQPYILQKR